MTDWLHDPMSLFDITGRVAIVTGASGAFGSLASRTLAGAGAKLVLVAGSAVFGKPDIATAIQDLRTPAAVPCP